MVTLRPYQQEAVDAVKTAWQKGFKRIVLELGMGAGKSVICAQMCINARKPGVKILVLCHQKEILEQNLQALKRARPDIKTSVYCQGLGAKDTSGEVIFAHVDSYVGCTETPQTSFVIVDECHRVPKNPLSRYQMVFEKCGMVYCVGLTATPYRLNGGKIYGNNKPFEFLAFKMGIAELIKAGFLTPFETIDENPCVIAGSGKIDYSRLGAQACQYQILYKSIEFIHQHMEDRKCTIIYCCSRAHAKAVQDKLEDSKYVDGTTPQEERRNLIEEMKEGKVRYVVNVDILTTGLDVPVCDGIVFLRPTESASLYVQAVGRALRLHTGKTKAKILELTDNMVRFGSITDPMLYGNDRERLLDGLTLGNKPPMKDCPKCGHIVPAPTRACPRCDYLFVKEKAYVGAQKEYVVIRYTDQWIKTSKGENCVKVTFETNEGTIVDFLNIESDNVWIAKQAKAKLRKLNSGKITRIRAARQKKNPTYWNVTSYHTTN